MFWNKYFCPSFILLIIVASLHWLASKELYYWTVEWYDFMMHLLGGAWVALSILWISEMSHVSRLKAYVTPRNTVILVLVVGILWEFLELALGFTDISVKGYTWDTTHDLIMDLIGVGLVIFFNRKKK